MFDPRLSSSSSSSSSIKVSQPICHPRGWPLLPTSRLTFFFLPSPIFPRLLIGRPVNCAFHKALSRCFAERQLFYGERAQMHLGACTSTPTDTRKNWLYTCTAAHSEIVSRVYTGFCVNVWYTHVYSTLSTIHTSSRACTYTRGLTACDANTDFTLSLSSYLSPNSVFQPSNIVISLGSCRSSPWHAVSLSVPAYPSPFLRVVVHIHPSYTFTRELYRGHLNLRF